MELAAIDGGKKPLSNFDFLQKDKFILMWCKYTKPQLVNYELKQTLSIQRRSAD